MHSEFKFQNIVNFDFIAYDYECLREGLKGMFSTNEKNCLTMRINDRGLRKILASLDFVGTKSV